MYVTEPKRNKPTVKVGDTFPNKHIPDDQTVELIGYSTNQAVKVQFPDGRVGYGSVIALRAGSIKPV